MGHVCGQRAAGPQLQEEHLQALHSPNAASLPLSSHRLPRWWASGSRVLNHKLDPDVWGGVIVKVVLSLPHLETQAVGISWPHWSWFLLQPPNL